VTAWTTPALLLLGIAAGPNGLNLLSPPALQVMDLGISMALAMLGVFVGLNLDFRPPRIESFAAVSAIIAAGVIVGTMRAPAAGPLLLLMAALAAVAISVALAGWLLVGQTDSDAEQHVFVVGSLLVMGGAMTYLSLSALLAGLLAGQTWNLAGNIAKARIARDLDYFQHPLVVLVLLTAGASAPLSVDTLTFGVLFVAIRSLLQAIGALSASVIFIALALDVFRVDGGLEWSATMLGAIVIGTIFAEALFAFLPARVPSR